MENLNLIELDKSEAQAINGGAAPLVGAAAIAAGCGLLLGAFVVGALVAYGTCWAINKLVTK